MGPLIALSPVPGVLSRTKWEEFEDNYRSPSPRREPFVVGGYACSFTASAENGNLARSLAKRLSSGYQYRELNHLRKIRACVIPALATAVS